jgi:hypothetical protein
VVVRAWEAATLVGEVGDPKGDAELGLPTFNSGNLVGSAFFAVLLRLITVAGLATARPSFFFLKIFDFHILFFGEIRISWSVFLGPSRGRPDWPHQNKIMFFAYHQNKEYTCMNVSSAPSANWNFRVKLSHSHN